MIDERLDLALNHPDWWVRYEVVHDVLRRRDRRPEVIALLGRVKDGDSAPRVRRAAEKALDSLAGKINVVPPSDATVPAAELLRTPDPRLASEDPHARICALFDIMRAASVFGASGASQAVLRAVREAFDDADHAVVHAAFEAYPMVAPDDPMPRQILLDRLRSETAENLLWTLVEVVPRQSDFGTFAEHECLRLLRHSSPDIRYWALYALEWMHDYAGVPAEPWLMDITPLLRDPAAEVRLLAASLINICAPATAVAALPGLTALCWSDDYESRAMGRLGLRCLGRPARSAAAELVERLRELPPGEWHDVFVTLRHVGVDDPRLLDRVVAALDDPRLYSPAEMPGRRLSAGGALSAVPAAAALLSGTTGRSREADRAVVERAAEAAIRADLATGNPQYENHDRFRDRVRDAINGVVEA